MITKIELKNVNSLILQLSDCIDHPDFIEFACKSYKEVMHFSHCHFAHLQQDGNLLLENKIPQDFAEGMAKYQNEDIWKPENSGIAINKIIHNRIDKDFCFELSKTTNLYNWMYYDQKAFDSFGTIHPCLTAFSCILRDENPLDDDEAVAHFEASSKIIKLYYLHQKLKRAEIFENLFTHANNNFNSPYLILDNNFKMIYAAPGFSSELRVLSLSFKDLVINLKNTIASGSPIIENYKEYHEWTFYSLDDKFIFTIDTRFSELTKFYVVSVKHIERSTVSYTPRERDILLLIYEGLSNAEISEKLYISKFTVKKHISNMMHKANVKNRISLLKNFSII